MPIDFPLSPAINDQFVAGGTTFVFNGQGWLIKPSAGGGTTVDAYTKMESDSKFVDVAGDTISGILNVPTALAATSNNQAASTAFVHAVAGGIPDAPNDGILYGRKNLAWSPASESTPIPSGSVMLFWQAAAPTGWTKLTTQNDKALRVVSGAGGAVGGSTPFSTIFTQTVTGAVTLSTTYIPPHYHSLGDSLLAASGVQRGIPNNTFPGSLNSGSVGDGYSHAHSLVMSLQYIDLILASKN